MVGPLLTGPLKEPSSRCFFPSLLNGNRTAPEEVQRDLVSFNLDSCRMQELRKQGVSPLCLLELAWGLILRAYTASGSVCYGILGQFNGRDNFLGLRHDINLDQEESVRKLLGRLKDYRSVYSDGASIQTPEDLHKYCDTAISWHQEIALFDGVNAEIEKVCCPVSYRGCLVDILLNQFSLSFQS